MGTKRQLPESERSRKVLFFPGRENFFCDAWGSLRGTMNKWIALKLEGIKLDARAKLSYCFHNWIFSFDCCSRLTRLTREIFCQFQPSTGVKMFMPFRPCLVFLLGSLHPLRRANASLEVPYGFENRDLPGKAMRKFNEARTVAYARRHCASYNDGNLITWKSKDQWEKVDSLRGRKKLCTVTIYLVSASHC